MWLSTIYNSYHLDYRNPLRVIRFQLYLLIIWDQKEVKSRTFYSWVCLGKKKAEFWLKSFCYKKVDPLHMKIYIHMQNFGKNNFSLWFKVVKVCSWIRTLVGLKYILKMLSSMNFLSEVKLGITIQSFIPSILGTCSKRVDLAYQEPE